MPASPRAHPCDPMCSGAFPCTEAQCDHSQRGLSGAPYLQPAPILYTTPPDPPQEASPALGPLFVPIILESAIAFSEKPY